MKPQHACEVHEDAEPTFLTRFVIRDAHMGVYVFSSGIFSEMAAKASSVFHVEKGLTVSQTVNLYQLLRDKVNVV